MFLKVKFYGRTINKKKFFRFVKKKCTQKCYRGVLYIFLNSCDDVIMMVYRKIKNRTRVSRRIQERENACIFFFFHYKKGLFKKLKFVVLGLDFVVQFGTPNLKSAFSAINSKDDTSPTEECVRYDSGFLELTFVSSKLSVD